MFEELFSRLAPEQIKELQRLSDEAKRTRLEFVEVLTKQTAKKARMDRKVKEAIAVARGAKKMAQDAKVDAYKALGLNRQTFWQFDNLSRGLCRFCAHPQDEKGGLCAECRRGQWKEKR